MGLFPRHALHDTQHISRSVFKYTVIINSKRLALSVTTKETTPGYCRNLYSFCMKAGPNYNFVYQVTEESFLDVVVGNNFLVANNALKNIYLFIHPFIHSFKYIFIRLLSVSFLIHLFDNLFTYLFNGVYIHLLSEVLQLRTEKKRRRFYIRDIEPTNKLYM